MTIVIVSPAWAGNRSSSSSMAAFESVPGDRKSCLFSPPKRHRGDVDRHQDDDPGDDNERRWRKDQEVMRFNMSACFRLSGGRCCPSMPILSGGRDAPLTAHRRPIVAAGVMKVSGPPCKLAP